jgi:hypothetical protein
MKKRQRKKNKKRYEQLFRSEITMRYGGSPLDQIAAMAQEIKKAYYTNENDNSIKTR